VNENLPLFIAGADCSYDKSVIIHLLEKQKRTISNCQFAIMPITLAQRELVVKKMDDQFARFAILYFLRIFNKLK